MRRLRQGVSLLLCAAMVLSMAGCGKKKDKEAGVLNYDGKPNVTISPESKWYDSTIYGMIDSSLNVSEKDDFYTAVNKDWLLEQQKPTKDVDDITLLMEGLDIVKDRLINIVSGEDDPDAFAEVQVDLDEAEIQHDQDLVVQFVDVAADWDARNAAGVEPLRKYIEAIEAISTIDELTQYITDIEGNNISLECFLELDAYAGVVDAGAYRSVVLPSTEYVLSKTSYVDITARDHRFLDATADITEKVLGNLGYSSKEIKKISKDCYKLEGMLIDHTNEKLITAEALQEKGVSLDYMNKLCGAFPFEKIYKAYGYEITDDIRMIDKNYMKYLGRIYKQSNLELFKAYYIMHTINNNIMLLNRDLYDEVVEAIEGTKTTPIMKQDDGKGDVHEAEIKDEWDIILNKFVMPYLAGPLNVVYISRYCSVEQKQELVEMIDDILAMYRVMIEEEEWMSEPAKEATLEKLDYITVRTLYPDKMESYMDLEFDESDDLLQMVHKVRANHIKLDAAKVETKVDKSLWDLCTDPTTTVNCFYRATDNSINILAGIVSGENIFNVDSPDEVNYARMATIIGHEISHAFDSSGCKYDKYGNKKNWWDSDDTTTFQLRVMNIVQYYNGITPFPGQKNLSGATVSGEVIADMGGMGVVLRMAKEKPDFDYDLFFRSYAQLWRTSRSMGLESAYASQDVHPLANLRTNVTVMQFDEFMNTYGVNEGDGMYCAPDKRIKVW